MYACVKLDGRERGLNKIRGLRLLCTEHHGMDTLNGMIDVGGTGSWERRGANPRSEPRARRMIAIVCNRAVHRTRSYWIKYLHAYPESQVSKGEYIFEWVCIIEPHRRRPPVKQDQSFCTDMAGKQGEDSERALVLSFSPELNSSTLGGGIDQDESGCCGS